MRRIWLAALVVLLASPSWAQPVAGVIGVLSGSASVEAGAGAVPLRAGQSVREGATVKTGPDTRVRLDLSDGTSLTLGSETTFRLEHLAGSGDAAPSRFSLVLGFVRALVTPHPGRVALEIGTEEVVAAVRGTEWVEHVTADATEVFVAAGHVALRGAGGAVTLAPGQGVTYSRTARHTPVTRWAAAKIAAIDAATRLP